MHWVRKQFLLRGFPSSTGMPGLAPSCNPSTPASTLQALQGITYNRLPCPAHDKRMRWPLPSLGLEPSLEAICCISEASARKFDSGSQGPGTNSLLLSYIYIYILIYLFICFIVPHNPILTILAFICRPLSKNSLVHLKVGRGRVCVPCSGGGARRARLGRVREGRHRRQALVCSPGRPRLPSGWNPLHLLSCEN